MSSLLPAPAPGRIPSSQDHGHMRQLAISSCQTCFTSSPTACRILAILVIRSEGPEPSANPINIEEKDPQKILLYSLETLLKKREKRRVCKRAGNFQTS